jgi:predicted pyridoxine 5'-phosphate oxidase superfamily flavin-nucleotide-binding protein
MSTAADVVFPPRVREEQQRRGSRQAYEERKRKRPFPDRVMAELVAFLATIDTAFLGTVAADARPYIQHRGGPKGFIKVLDERTLAFADFAGNRQYITLANLAENDKAYLFLIDFATRQRVKIWGRARVVEDDPDLLTALSEPSYRARPERVIVFTIEAWDTNCPSHITPRFAEADIEQATAITRERIARLDAEVASLRARLGMAHVLAQGENSRCERPGAPSQPICNWARKLP